jgi:hypothetical protein
MGRLLRNSHGVDVNILFTITDNAIGDMLILVRIDP